MTETDLTNLEKTYGSVEGVSEIIEAYRNQETHTGDQLITDGQKDIVEFMEAFNEAVADGMTETDLTNLEKTYGDVEGVAEIIEAYRNQAPSTPVTPTPTQTEFDKFMTEYVSLLNDADGLTTVDLDTLESKYGAVEGVSAFLAAYRNQESHTNDQIITEDQKDKLENYDELEAKNQYLAAEEQELDAFTQLYNTKGVTVEQLQAARDSYAATDNAAYGSNSTDTMDSMIAQKVELNSQVQQAKAEIEALKASGAANSEFLDELYYALTLAESGEMTDAEIREFLSSLYGIDLPSNTNPSAPDAPIRGE